MIWVLLFSLVVKSVRDTMSARKRGEPVTLKQNIKSNFLKIKKRIKQKFIKKKKAPSFGNNNRKWNENSSQLYGIFYE